MVEKLITQLISLKEEGHLFTNERCAADVGVTTQTVKNFENRTCTNAEVMLYYLSKVLWALEYEQLKFIKTKTREECIAERDEIIAELLILF